jgi:predicted phage tail protein
MKIISALYLSAFFVSCSTCYCTSVEEYLTERTRRLKRKPAFHKDGGSVADVKEAARDAKARLEQWQEEITDTNFEEIAIYMNQELHDVYESCHNFAGLGNLKIENNGDFNINKMKADVIYTINELDNFIGFR